MKLKLKAGTTSKKVRVFIQDLSVTTTVQGLTGLTNATSGLTWYYFRDGDTSATAVSIASATLGTFTSGGFKEVDATHMAGVYELGVPNAALSVAGTTQMYLYGATNMIPVLIECELDAVDYQDAVAFGLSRVDAAISSRMATYTQPTGFLAATFPSGTIANTTNITAGTITTTTNLTNFPGIGVGAFAVTVKVTSDGTTPIPSTAVRLSSAGQNVAGITDVNGNVSFNVNPDTFTVSTMAVGFTSAPFTKIVDGSGHFTTTGTSTLTVTLTATSLPAASAGHVTAFLYTRDGQGNILTSKTVSFQLMDPLANTDAWVTSKFTAVSDGTTGLLNVQLLQNAKYRMATSGGQVDFTTGTSSPFALPEVLGL